MEDLLKNIASFQNITTVISLVAFCFAAILSYLFYSNQVKITQQRKEIEKAPESERSSLIQQTFDKWGIDGQNLSNRQKFEFIAKYENRKERRFYFTIIMALVFAILAAILIYNTLDYPYNSTNKQPKKDHSVTDSIVPPKYSPQMANVKLIVSSRFSKAQIFIDNKSAQIVENTAIVKTIQVEINRNHEFKLVVDSDTCTINAFVNMNNQKITGCN